MNTVSMILDALGGVNAVSQETRVPYQTVHSWKTKGAVPIWRRPILFDMARRRKVPLDQTALAYLAEAE